MPRRARIVFPGFVYHVTQRGNHRQKVFLEDKDRVLYLKYINEYSRKYHLKIYAFCLMGNHVHFIVSPGNKASLANVFQITHQRYAYYFQQKTKQQGHLWQGRFFSCLLQGRHLKQAVRYVEKNPVRAGLVSFPWEYSWSSVRAHLGTEYRIIKLSDINEILDVHDWRSYLLSEERKNFLKLIRRSTFKERIMGSKKFVRELEETFKVKLLPGRRGRPKNNSDK